MPARDHVRVLCIEVKRRPDYKVYKGFAFQRCMCLLTGTDDKRRTYSLSKAFDDKNLTRRRKKYGY